MFTCDSPTGSNILPYTSVLHEILLSLDVLIQLIVTVSKNMH